MTLKGPGHRFIKNESLKNENVNPLSAKKSSPKWLYVSVRLTFRIHHPSYHLSQFHSLVVSLSDRTVQERVFIWHLSRLISP